MAIEKLTHGGMPESEAYHWTRATYQRFGKIVCDLTSAGSDRRERGYNDYYNMRRYFMAAEWDEKMRDIDIFRVANRHRPLQEILAEISEQVVRDKKPAAAVESSPMIPAWYEPLPPVSDEDDVWPEFDPTPSKKTEEIKIEPKVVLKTPTVTVEQLSLF